MPSSLASGLNHTSYLRSTDWAERYSGRNKSVDDRRRTQGIGTVWSVCDAVKHERWGEAERTLRELQQIVRELRLDVREMQEGRPLAQFVEGT
jgi:hypothetical protein